MTVRRRTIKVSSQNCTGCQLCKLACSHIKTASFSLSQARISITRLEFGERYEVGFTQECDRCGFCIGYCCFGAISRGSSPEAAGRGRAV